MCDTEENDGYYLKRILPHNISDNVFVPSEPPKPTNIGVVLTKYVHPTDDSYGVHQTKYGGIGYGKIDHPDFQAVPRRGNHYRSGVDLDIEDPPSERRREQMLERNKAFLAQPINYLGTVIFDTFKNTTHRDYVSEYKQKESRIFLTSPIYDYDNIRLANFERLQKKQGKQQTTESDESNKKASSVNSMSNDTSCTPGSLMKLDCKDYKKKYDQERKMPEKWWPDKPFWYDPNKAGVKAIPPRNLSDYSEYMPSVQIDNSTWLQEMELDNAKNYLPGEIYKNVRPKQPIEDLSKTGGCSKSWKPRDPNFYNNYYDVEKIPNEMCLEKEVEERRVMSYKESLGLEEPATEQVHIAASPCHFRNRNKKNTATRVCDCQQCKSKKLYERAVENVEDVKEDKAGKITDYKLTEAWQWPGRKKGSGWGEHRNEELKKKQQPFRVGYPFQKDAAIWKSKMFFEIKASPHIHMPGQKRTLPEWYKYKKSSIT